MIKCKNMIDTTAKFEDILRAAADVNRGQPDEDDKGLIRLLLDSADAGIRVAEASAALDLTKETVRYRLLSLQAAGIVTSRKISRSERRYFLNAMAQEA
jgi:DNA-binding Lrp family transcriptional regulator